MELPKEVKQIELKEDPLAFVQREKYVQDIEEPIIDFLSDFIQKEFLEEDRINDNKENDVSHSLEVPPVILFIDNVFLMDKPSWELLETLKRSCKRICFVLMIKVNPNNQPVLLPEAEDVATEFLSQEDNNDVMIDLSALEEEELKSLL